MEVIQVNNIYTIIIIILAFVCEVLITFIFWKSGKRKIELPVISNVGEYGVSTLYTYFVRLRTGNCTVNFDHKTTKIILNFLNKTRKRVESLTIPPDYISRYGKRDHQSNIPEMRMLRLYWVVSDLLPPFEYIQLTHNCRVPNSTITVYDVDIREVESELAVKAVVNASIDCVIDPNAVQQTYLVRNVKSPYIDDVHSPLTDCGFCDRLLINWYFVSIHLLVSSFFPYSPENVIRDSSAAIVNGIVAAIIGHILTLIYFITFLGERATFSPYFGNEFRYLNMFWNFNTIIFTFAASSVAAMFGSQLRANYPENSIYGTITATFYRIIIYELSLSSLIKYMKSKRMKVHDDLAFFAQAKKSEEKRPLAGVPRTPSGISIQSTGSTYFHQLLKDNNIARVKSISQYGALLAQQEPP